MLICCVDTSVKQIQFDKISICCFDFDKIKRRAKRSGQVSIILDILAVLFIETFADLSYGPF